MTLCNSGRLFRTRNCHDLPFISGSASSSFMVTDNIVAEAGRSMLTIMQPGKGLAYSLLAARILSCSDRSKSGLFKDRTQRWKVDLELPNRTAHVHKSTDDQKSSTYSDGDYRPIPHVDVCAELNRKHPMKTTQMYVRIEGKGRC